MKTEKGDENEMNECVLVVDDDREIVKAIALLLEKEGYQVLKAYDGMEALELAAEKPVRLIIMDVMMPRLDGLSAVMKIRERKNLPIIVLSAKSEETDKILGLSMGADDYVAKTFFAPGTGGKGKESAAALYDAWRYSCGVYGRRDSKRAPLLSDFRTDALCRRGAGETDSHRDKDRGTFDEKSRQDISGRGDLQPCLGRRSLFRRKYGHGPYPAHSGKDRAQSEKTRIFEGGVGNWVQDGKSSGLSLVLALFFWE